MTVEMHGGRMAGERVLVTGGTSGIGRATALGLAAMGAHLAITGRDRGRANDAAREIRAAGGGRVDVFVADLSTQSEVRRLSNEVLHSLSRIDVLVNNVGGYWNTRHVTADGLAHLRRQPSGAVPAHQSAPRPVEAEHASPRGYGFLQRSLLGAHPSPRTRCIPARRARAALSGA